MGKTLKQMVEEFQALKGADTYGLLAKKVGKSPKTIRRWINERIPSSHAAYQLAKALGCEKEEAIRMANEPLPATKKTA